MSQNISTQIGDFKGKPTFTINKEYQDKDGNKKSSRVLTFGVSKAKILLSLMDDIKKFVEENDNGNVQQIDLDKLTPEQKELVNSFINKL